MKFLRKFISFTLENFNGKLFFCPFFLPFSRVPEAVGEFFAFNFFPFAVWGGFFRLVWTSGESEEKGGLDSCFKIKFLIFFFHFHISHEMHNDLSCNNREMMIGSFAFQYVFQTFLHLI